MVRNPHFSFFCSFFIALLTPFIIKPISSRDLTIYFLSPLSSFEIINVIVLEPRIFLRILASVSAATAAVTVNPSGIKTLLANGLSTFFSNSKPSFNNGPKILPTNLPVCPIYDK